MVDLISNISIGDKESQKKDLLGQVYEYFLGRFADAEGKRGGQFYTDQSVVKLMVEMLGNLDGEDIQVDLSTPTRAGIFRPTDKQENEDLLMLLMPMMLND